VITVRATRYQRERWVTPDGQTILAPLPEGIDGHFGAELHRFVLMQFHQGQSTLPRTLALLRSAGVSISKRQLQRLLTEKQDGFITEAEDVLRAGLETSPFVVDDTGARHKGKNGFCTQIGNEWFTWFGMRFSRSRLNFLDLLRAGHTDYVLNDAAYDYMRDQGLPAVTIARLRAQPKTRFNDQATWLAYLDRLRPTALRHDGYHPAGARIPSGARPTVRGSCPPLSRRRSPNDPGDYSILAPVLRLPERTESYSHRVGQGFSRSIRYRTLLVRIP
jgi:hypothetical protein